MIRIVRDVSASLIKFTNLEAPSNLMNSSTKRSSSDYENVIRNEIYTFRLV